jgi:hypothetical protein
MGDDPQLHQLQEGCGVCSEVEQSTADGADFGERFSVLAGARVACVVRGMADAKRCGAGRGGDEAAAEMRITQQKAIMNECEAIIEHCQQALEHCVTLSASMNEDHLDLPESIAGKLRLALFQTKILLEFKGKKATECQQDK